MNNQLVENKNSDFDIVGLSDNVKSICTQYGLYGSVVSYKPYPLSEEADIYFVASMYPIPDDVNPKEIADREERSFAIVHPKSFAFKFSSESALSFYDELVQYCKQAEFVKKLYSEFKTPVPDKLRTDELYALIEYNDGRYNPKLTPSQRGDYEKGLEQFFKNENQSSQLKKEWLSHYRSEKFEANTSLAKTLFNFFKRESPEISLTQLQSTSDDLKVAVINEHEYEKFKTTIQEKYPDVVYSVTECEKIDKGLLKTSSSLDKEIIGPYGKVVTYKEFCSVLDKDFAEKGYEAIKDLNPLYFETRWLTYRSVDEPIVAKTINNIRYSYAKCNSLLEIKGHGDTRVVSIPINDFRNFVSLAKANNLPFYVDYDGLLDEPSLSCLQIAYGSYHEPLVNGIIDRILSDKVQFSHYETSSNTLDKRIEEAARSSSSHGVPKGVDDSLSL